MEDPKSLTPASDSSPILVIHKRNYKHRKNIEKVKAFIGQSQTKAVLF